MKILLDESLPRKLKNEFGEGHEVFTVQDKGWLGKENGELLQLMTNDQFELFVIVDKNLAHQQNIDKLQLTIIVLRAISNRIETLTLLMPKLLARLAEGNLGKVIEFLKS